MINQFPSFSKLILEHKEAVYALTDAFKPYSDFNFTSLFCWDTEGSTEISLLNGNLVIKLPDYITNETIYSILGNHQIDESINTLLNEFGEVQLVPEATLQNLDQQQKFAILEDENQYDYIYQLEALVALAGKSYKVKRNKLNNFMRTYGDRLKFKDIQFETATDKNYVKDVFSRWATERERDAEEVNNERIAIDRLLEHASGLDLMGILVFIDDVAVGFSINEKLANDYAVCHFQKAILEFEHLDVFITNHISKSLLKLGCKYVNWEQDLGLEGLRALKKSYQPASLLKKYQVKLISGTS